VHRPKQGLALLWAEERAASNELATSRTAT
jgi:hypothetical protein